MDPDPRSYIAHTPYSDPGACHARWEAIPADADARDIAAVVRNLLYHYRADGISVPDERRDDIDLRWTARALERDLERHPEPIDHPRAQADRLAGCCRDFTELAVSALRERGVPARGRVGFAGYFGPGYHYDHVVVEHWDGVRWVRLDAQLVPEWFGFDTGDLPRDGLEGFVTGAEAWRAIRSGAADARSFGVFPGSPFSGAGFVGAYVIRDLAHLNGEELLLWDLWGDLVGEGAPDAAHATWLDGVAALMVDADAGDAEAFEALRRLWAGEDRVNPRGHVVQASPFGSPDVAVDLRRDAPDLSRS